MADYKAGYEKWFHRLAKVCVRRTKVWGVWGVWDSAVPLSALPLLLPLLQARVGLPFHHDSHSNAPVCWRHCRYARVCVCMFLGGGCCDIHYGLVVSPSGLDLCYLKCSNSPLQPQGCFGGGLPSAV